jgi:mono/diheme cytochrome c family protein
MKKTRSIPLTVVLALFWTAAASAGSEGKALYVSKCAMCHGEDGVPKKMGAGSKAFGDPEFKKSAKLETVVSCIREGKGKMKPVRNVTEPEAYAIAAHVLTIGSAK